MGAVYRARDLHFPNIIKLVAVKEMTSKTRDPGLRLGSLCKTLNGKPTSSRALTIPLFLVFTIFSSMKNMLTW